jgi:transposase-like protein
VATALQMPQTEPSEWPPCPWCGSKEFVHRAGWHRRKQFPPARRYACTRCGKNNRFIHPAAQRYRPGKIRNLAVQPLPQLLNEPWMESWARARGLSGSTELLQEIVAAEKAAYRAHRLEEQRRKARPFGEGESLRIIASADVHREKISDAQRAEIRELHVAGEPIATLAQRFGVGRSTIARIVQNSHRKLDPEAAQRIILLHEQGVAADKIALRFGGTPSTSTIARVIKEYDSRPHNPSAVQPGENRPRGRALLLPGRPDWNRAPGKTMMRSSG